MPDGSLEQDPLDADCTPDLQCNAIGKNLGAPENCGVGNPVNPSTGNKYQSQVDYQGSGAFPLKLVRHYNSEANRPGRAGYNWNIFPSLSVLSGTTVQATRPDMKGFQFSLLNGQWQPDADVNERLVRLIDGLGNLTGWELTLAEGVVETYAVTGTLTGYRHSSGLLISVSGADSNHTVLTDIYGRSLNLYFDTQNHLTTLTDPSGGFTTYAYDAAGNLIAVTYPDATSKTYHYEDANFPHALTGITDENGDRYATWAYDAQGRAISSEHAGGAERVDLNYNADGSTTVTDALGTARTYGFETILGVVKGTGISQPGGAGCGAASSAVSHDANGNTTTRDDFNGHRTRYWHDMARNLETTRVEGLAVNNGNEAATPETRTFTTAWHPDWRLPTEEKTYTGGADSSGTPLGTLVKTVTSTYDTSGNLLTRTETDNPRGESRTWTYTYFSLGRIASADGPRTDVADITTYDYYPDDDPDLARRGQLWKITNALGHVTEILAYDLHGQSTQIRDPNGLVTTRAYDARGRLLSRTMGTRVTGYAYDAAGQLTGLTLPDGTTIAFGYDAAHRLVGIQDAQGNRIAYTLDGLGNRVAETVYDAQGNPVRSLDRVFDALGRLWKEVRRVNGQDAVTEYGYDAQGNPTLRADPLSHSTRTHYDALDRLARSEDALQGQTDVVRTVLDEVAGVTDPKGLNTAYEKDAFGQVRKETSPDRGITLYTYDAAGNLKTRTDARGKTISYRYDALDRLTRKYISSSQETIYSYDEGELGRGRLTRMMDPSPFPSIATTTTTTWSHDDYGTATAKSQAIGSMNLRILQEYDATGRPSRLTYPTGTVVGYAYDQGRISQISVNGNVLISNLQYQPFGPAESWTWGNGTAYGRGFDRNGWPQSYPLGTLGRTLRYDAAGRIAGYGHAGQPNYDTLFGYDALGRLQGYSTYQGGQEFIYDANGNRTLHNSGDTNYPYTLAANSNRLLSVAGPVAKTYQYDAAGNITRDGPVTSSNALTYDGFGRLSRHTWGDRITNYSYNGLGQRISKSGWGGGLNGILLFMYDEAGHLLGEYNATGQAVQETVWLGDMPVAVIKGGAVYYVYADHLNAPRVITDTQNRPVWCWDNADPFGVGLPNENPSGLGVFSYHLRFPGQYYDKETGLHYNYFRDYEPRTGRYVQADPIGVEGGLNPYGYVLGNPLSYIDPLGLEAEMCYRPIEGYIIPGQHCFARFNGKNNDTLSFDLNGVGPDPSPQGATCEKAKGPEDDDCVKRKMKKCQNYDFFKNNCCHCVEQALRACRQSIPLKKWPNYPINPGPQPGESGYKP